MTIPPRAPQNRLDLLFPDVVTPNPDQQEFEVGLVLGGTVSAGAYTAGALDFLLQALEAWQGYGQFPPHKVVIKTAGGSSGGAVCAAILSLLSGRGVPHIDVDPIQVGPDTPNPSGPPTNNPLWDLWVNALRIEGLLSTDDISANQDADAGTSATMTNRQHVPALLNCQLIDDAGAALAAIGTTQTTVLSYFAAPFRIAVTVANLRGIPYDIQCVPAIQGSPNADGSTPVEAFTGAAFVQHDDFAWFAVPNGADPAAASPVTGKREDEFWLLPTDQTPPVDGNDPNGFVGYDTLVHYATASGAMPVGLAARYLTRPAEHDWYRPRVRASVSEPTGYTVDWPNPDWDQLPESQASGSYSFTSVDGGTFNNDPVSLVHCLLAGLVGKNPTGKSDAKRAILMIDPLSDQPADIPPVGKSLLAVVEALIPTFVGAARYLTADMELFADKDIFSRFQMVPNRPDPEFPNDASKARVGEKALAGTSLYAAAGWCARKYRVHDYLLGRSNMQSYLRQQFVPAGDNSLFNNWSLDSRKDWALDGRGNRIAIDENTDRFSYFLPIIPDTTGAAIPVPEWPAGA